MTTVQVTLYDDVEMFGFAQFYQQLLARRAQLAARLKETPVPQQTSVPNHAVEEAVEAVYDDAPAATAAPASETPKAAFGRYIETKGLKAGREALEAFGVKKFAEIPADKMGEFLATLRW